MINDNSLTTIRQHLNLTLEELNLDACDDAISYTGLLELKSMPRLKCLNLSYCLKDDEEKIKNLRQHLPHVMIWVDFLPLH